MKPGKLYIKIFLSFVLILFITEILVFGLFLFSVGRHFRSRIDQYTGAKSLVAKELLEDNNEHPFPALSESLMNIKLCLDEKTCNIIPKMPPPCQYKKD